jgi:hypothetical protein
MVLPYESTPLLPKEPHLYRYVGDVPIGMDPYFRAEDA